MYFFTEVSPMGVAVELVGCFIRLLGMRRKENGPNGGVKNLICRGVNCILSSRRFEILAGMAHF